MRRAWIAFVVASCASAPPRVEYLPEDAKASPMPARATIAEYEIDCTLPVSKNAHWEGSRLKVYVDAAERFEERCYFHGGKFPWNVLGVLGVPFDAGDRWDDYRAAMRDRARAVGCEGIAFVRNGPIELDAKEGPVGALCVGGDRTLVAPIADPDVLPADQGDCHATADCPKPFTCKKGRCE